MPAQKALPKKKNFQKAKHEACMKQSSLMGALRA